MALIHVEHAIVRPVPLAGRTVQRLQKSGKQFEILEPLEIAFFDFAFFLTVFTFSTAHIEYMSMLASLAQ